MPITVTPQPGLSPPRVRVDIISDDPAKPFTSLTVLRDGVPIREQPYVGGTETVAWDYEAPFGVEVTYSVEGAVSTFSTVLEETWASLTGWTTFGGTPSVAGSHLHGGYVSRTLAAPAKGRLVSQGLVPASANGARLRFGKIDIVNSASASGSVSYGSTDQSVSGLQNPFTLLWDEDAATLMTSTGTWKISLGGSKWPAATKVYAYTESAPDSYVEDFTISTPVEAPFAASTVVSLDVFEAWLIHPTYPGLSVSIDPGRHRFRSTGINVDRTSKSSKTRAARSTRHEPFGRPRAVVITSGSRAAAEWSLVLRTMRLEDRDAVESITDDQTPLLLRSPAGWTWDLPDDWYSVGDYVEDRPRPRLDSPERLLTLPMSPVDPPVVRQASVWTYGADLLLNPTYADSLRMFPTYLDRLAGPS